MALTRANDEGLRSAIRLSGMLVLTVFVRVSMTSLASLDCRVRLDRSIHSGSCRLT